MKRVYLAQNNDTQGLEAFIYDKNVEPSIIGWVGSIQRDGIRERKPGVLLQGNYTKHANYPTGGLIDDQSVLERVAEFDEANLPKQIEMKHLESEYPGCSGDYLHLIFDEELKSDEITRVIERIFPEQI